MDPVMATLLALLMGVVGGAFHQAMDRAKVNDAYAWIRSVLIGGLAGFFAGLAAPAGGSEFYFITFSAGYFGDSFILNIVDRYKPSESTKE